MNGLIARIEANDPDMDTLLLTSECETVDEVYALQSALECKNTFIDKVVYRESFFPLRRLRMHLSHNDFLTFLHVVSGISGLRVLELPPCMPGMLTGRHVVHTLERTTTLRRFEAEGAITFISRTHDVQELVDKLMQSRDHLMVIDLDDSHFMMKRRRNRNGDADAMEIVDVASPQTPMLMDRLLNCSLPHLEQLLLSSGSAVSLSSSSTSRQSNPERPLQVQQCLISSVALRSFLVGDLLRGSSVSCLIHLKLTRLGLDDNHVLAVAEFLRFESCALQRLELAGNQSITSAGNRTLVESLRFNARLEFLWTTKPATDTTTVATSASPIGFSSCGNRNSETISWSEIFTDNCHLLYLKPVSLFQYQKLDEDDDTGDLAVDNNGYESRNELQFWLALNRLGRRQWWRDNVPGLCKHDWIFVLEDVSLLQGSACCTASLLYYLIRNYPTKFE